MDFRCHPLPRVNTCILTDCRICCTICMCCVFSLWTEFGVHKGKCCPAGHAAHPVAACKDAAATKGQLAPPVQPAASREETAASWSVAVTTRKDSAVRTRRPLYEAVLRLEREGAAVVDRDLQAEDIALSADTCCCIWTEDRLKVCPASI